MTRITWTEPDKDGNCELFITGHSNREACAALSALWEAFISGVERLALLHPADVGIYQPATESEIAEGINAAYGVDLASKTE